MGAAVVPSIKLNIHTNSHPKYCYDAVQVLEQAKAVRLSWLPASFTFTLNNLESFVNIITHLTLHTKNWHACRSISDAF